MTTLFLVDVTATPNIVVHRTDDASEASATAKQYADQTGHVVAVVEGDVLASIEREHAPTNEYSATPQVHSYPRSVDGT